MKNKYKRTSSYLFVIFLLLFFSGFSLIYAATSLEIITTIAGIGTFGFSGDGGLATEAQLDTPVAVVLDEAGHLYIADRFNHRVRKIIIPSNEITTVAGSGPVGPGNGSFSGDNGPATNARLNLPTSLALDRLGNLYIADDANNRIRKIISPTGVITTVAGNGSMTYGGDNGLATAAQLQIPGDIVVDNEGNLYIADSGNNRIRKVIAATGIITTVAGSGPTGLGNGDFSGDGGPASAALLDYPLRIALDGAGNLYIADANNHRIRKVIAATGSITTVVGSGPPGFGNGGFSGDGGLATNARLNFPTGVAVDAMGNLYIADNGNHRIRKVISATGVITTIAGIGVPTYNGDNQVATEAALNLPAGVALDKNGNFYLIADQDNHRIRKVEILNFNTGLIVTKTANVITTTVGETITYTYQVTNTGNITLTTLIAQDTPLGLVPLDKSSLVPGQGAKGILTYTVVKADLPGPLMNAVMVTATFINGKITATAKTSVRLSSEDETDQQMYFPIILKRH